MALLAALILWQLWPGVPAGLRLPVLAYVLCLASMAAQAAVLCLAARGTARQRGAAVLAIGGALFLASDALLASNKFAAPLPLVGPVDPVHLLGWRNGALPSWLPPRAPSHALEQAGVAAADLELLGVALAR